MNTNLSALTVEKERLLNEYQEIKADTLASRTSAEHDLSLVFPIDEGMTDLTRMFDEFAVKNNFQSNPFFISNINYQNASDASDESPYRVLPVSLSVTTSRKNLDKFLDYINDSGSLQSEVRLMNIKSLSLGIPAEYGGTYSARFEINAYFSREI